MKNPLIIGIACAVCVLGVREIFVAADVSFRLSDIGFVASALEYVAKMATPFGLIMLGGEFEFSAVGRLWKEIAFGTFMRVVFAPALFLTVAYFCIPGLSGAHYASYIALFGTPVAVSSAIMAKEMEGDAELGGTARRLDDGAFRIHALCRDTDIQKHRRAVKISESCIKRRGKDHTRAGRQGL